jgi:hypothetical protein
MQINGLTPIFNSSAQGDVADSMIAEGVCTLPRSCYGFIPVDDYSLYSTTEHIVDVFIVEYESKYGISVVGSIESSWSFTWLLRYIKLQLTAL